MPATKVPKGSGTPSVADFAVGGMMTAPMKALTSTDILREVMGPKGSARDLLGNPRAMDMMERMYKEANPVFRKLQQQWKRFDKPTASTANRLTDAQRKALAYKNEFEPWRGLKQLKSMLGY